MNPNREDRSSEARFLFWVRFFLVEDCRVLLLRPLARGRLASRMRGMRDGRVP